MQEGYTLADFSPGAHRHPKSAGRRKIMQKIGDGVMSPVSVYVARWSKQLCRQRVIGVTSAQPITYDKELDLSSSLAI
jgi:hypothetical protein